jgi:hypothetical protein
MGDVYLLHFHRPLGSKRHRAQHYIGYADNVVQRLALHRRGRSGVAIMRAVKRRRIGWHVARVWFDVDRTFERRLKRGGHYERHCPTCKELAQPAPERRCVPPVVSPVADGDLPW